MAIETISMAKGLQYESIKKRSNSSLMYFLQYGIRFFKFLSCFIMFRSKSCSSPVPSYIELSSDYLSLVHPQSTFFSDFN